MKKLFILLAILPLTVLAFTQKTYAYYYDAYLYEVVVTDGYGTPTDHTIGTNLYNRYSTLQILDSQANSGLTFNFTTLYTTLKNYADTNLQDYSGILTLPNNSTFVSYFGSYYEGAYLLVQYVRFNNTLYLNLNNKSGTTTFNFTATSNDGLDLFNFYTLKVRVDQQLINDAYDFGYEDGFDQGYNNGYDDGLQADAQESYDQGYDVGYLEGSTKSFLAGFDEWIVPAILFVLIGGGVVSVLAMKFRRRD